ncbi:MAG: hypothetical protein ABSB29_02565 [Nitrososphaerales archaeon]|jgi:hypothetical protein
MSVGERHRSRFEYPDVFIVLWSAAMFVAFGLLSNLYDKESFLYNLGQGAFIALFVGAMLYIVRWTARRRKKTAGWTRAAHPIPIP